MNIVQISAVVEYSDTGNEDHGTWQRVPNTDATVYGLGDDGKLYYWGVTKSTYVKTEPNEDNEYSDGHYDKQYGWKEATA